MPAASVLAPLIWRDTLRPPPAPGGWRRVGHFALHDRVLSGWAERREGRTLFVGDGLEHQRIGETLWPLLASMPEALVSPTRQVIVVGRGEVSDEQVGLANRRSEIWLTDGAGLLSRSGVEVVQLLAHELSHNAGGAIGGAPDEPAWAQAMAADGEFARRWLLAPGASGADPRIPVRIGCAAVSAYADAIGPAEDWADAVGFWEVERRFGPLVGPAAARALTGRGRALHFADCFARRAAIIERHLYARAG